MKTGYRWEHLRALREALSRPEVTVPEEPGKKPTVFQILTDKKSILKISFIVWLQGHECYCTCMEDKGALVGAAFSPSTRIKLRGQACMASPFTQWVISLLINANRLLGVRSSQKKSQEWLTSHLSSCFKDPSHHGQVCKSRTKTMAFHTDSRVCCFRVRVHGAEVRHLPSMGEAADSTVNHHTHTHTGE